MNDCLAHADRCKTVFTYEDLVIEKNLELVKAGREPLYAVYPRGSLAISDAPLGFAPHGGESDAAKRAILTSLQDYLLTDADAKAKLLRLGRRPAGSVGLSLDNPDLTVFNPAWGIQANLREQGITYPSATVIQSALDRYQTRYRMPVDVYYCLDGSGSMGPNNGWVGVRDAAHQIFDADQAALNMLQTHPDDKTTVAVFNGALTAGSPWTVQGNDPGRLHELTQKIIEYEPDGGTNMYACLARAATALGQAPDPQRKRLIIVMSDGQSERGQATTALAAVKQLNVPIVAIAFGDGADPAQLREVADATGGTFVQQNDLVASLRQAAGYK
jgi:Ca-activated chloride channel family protein